MIVSLPSPPMTSATVSRRRTTSSPSPAWIVPYAPSTTPRWSSPSVPVSIAWAIAIEAHARAVGEAHAGDGGRVTPARVVADAVVVVRDAYRVAAVADRHEQVAAIEPEGEIAARDARHHLDPGRERRDRLLVVGVVDANRVVPVPAAEDIGAGARDRVVAGPADHAGAAVDGVVAGGAEPDGVRSGAVAGDHRGRAGNRLARA